MFVRKKVILYLMVSAVCMLLAYVSGENVFQKMYLCFGMALGIGGYFCGRQYGNSGMFAGISFSFLLLPLGGHLLAVHQNVEVRKDRTCIFAILYIVLCLISQNRKNVKSFMQENGDLYRFPQKQLQQRSHILLITLCAVFIGGMLVSYKIAPDVNFDVVLTRGSTRARFEEMETNEEMDLTMEEKDAPVGSMEWIGAVGGVLYHISMVFLVVVLGGGVVLMLVRHGRGYRRKSTEAVEADLEPEEDLAEDLMPDRFSFKELFEPKTPTEMIRKNYKKWIKSALKIVPETDTPTELEQKSRRLDEEVHRLYEKARYSYMECTSEESRIVKQKT